MTQELLVKDTGVNYKGRYLNNTTIVNTLKNRFYQKVLLPNKDGCMEWTGSYRNNGYGQIKVNCKQMSAHRFSYILHFEKIATGKCVLHKCDNKKCVAPDHLWLGTVKQNNADRAKKGRNRKTGGELSPSAKLTNSNVLEIKNRLRSGEKVVILSKEFKVCHQTISSIKHNRNWSKVND